MSLENIEPLVNEVAQKILANKEMLSYMRAYLWDGFAGHNVAIYYESQTGHTPFSNIGLTDNEYGRAWWMVRDLVYPKVKELKDQYGEFGKVP